MGPYCAKARLSEWGLGHNKGQSIEWGALVVQQRPRAQAYRAPCMDKSGLEKDGTRPDCEIGMEMACGI
eukprot:1156350-Pelagomonas_calceolata.AAC.7